MSSPHKHVMWFMIPCKKAGNELFSSCYLYLEWWCDWEESRREEEGMESPLYSCLTTGGTLGHWKTPWKSKKRFTDADKITNSYVENKVTRPLAYPESFLRLSASESLCGWMSVWTALSNSFLQKERCSWAMGSAGGRWRTCNLLT